MSDREYFSLRYTVPGFVLILLIFGTNYSVILNIISRHGATDVFSVSIAILSLFASSSIGFLVSQIWFCIFHYKRIYASILRKEDMESSMKTSFGWKKADEIENISNEKERDEIMGTAIDYLLNDPSVGSNLFKFFQRKIDLYHTMSSAVISLSIGLGLGTISRLVLILSGRYLFHTLLDQFLFFFTFVAGSFFIIILMYLRKQIFFEYHPMLKLFLSRKHEQKNIQKLYELFPDYVAKKN